jgi:hypothetical protein
MWKKQDNALPERYFNHRMDYLNRSMMIHSIKFLIKVIINIIKHIKILDTNHSKF